MAIKLLRKLNREFKVTYKRKEIAPNPFRNEGDGKTTVGGRQKAVSRGQRAEKQ
jgi:hypothetical protein